MALLDGRQGSHPGQVVRNNIIMDDDSGGGMFILTGPNMTGKSTILRALAAVSLLGACGLLVPAAADGTSIPYIDAFMLRNLAPTLH